MVSAAVGVTGSLVRQIAMRLGDRVVGITGSDEKRHVLEEVLGFDAAVSHRSADPAGDRAAACPDGIDVYVDGVGGPVRSWTRSSRSWCAR